MEYLFEDASLHLNLDREVNVRGYPCYILGFALRWLEFVVATGSGEFVVRPISRQILKSDQNVCRDEGIRRPWKDHVYEGLGTQRSRVTLRHGFADLQRLCLPPYAVKGQLL